MAGPIMATRKEIERMRQDLAERFEKNEQLKAMLQQETANLAPILGAARGASLGLSDVLASGLMPEGAKAAGQLRERHPVASGLGELGGALGLASTLPMAKLGSGALRAIGASAGVGGLLGASQGAGEALTQAATTDKEFSLEDLAKKAAIGGAAGAAGGGALRTLGRVAGPIAGQMQRALQAVPRALERRGGHSIAGMMMKGTGAGMVAGNPLVGGIAGLGMAATSRALGSQLGQRAVQKGSNLAAKIMETAARFGEEAATLTARGAIETGKEFERGKGRAAKRAKQDSAKKRQKLQEFYRQKAEEQLRSQIGDAASPEMVAEVAQQMITDQLATIAQKDPERFAKLSHLFD